MLIDNWKLFLGLLLMFVSIGAGVYSLLGLIPTILILVGFISFILLVCWTTEGNS